MFDLQRLRALHAVRQHGSVAAAAEALGFTASAVSQQITKLEREARAPLLEKAGRGVILTEAAAVLADAAEEILQTTERAGAALEELHSGVSGYLRMMCFPTAIRGLVAPALGELRRSAPELTVSVTEEWFRALAAVEGGHADVAVTHDWLDVPTQFSDQLHTEHLLVDPVDIVLPVDHPLSHRKRIGIEDLLDEPWIIDVRDDVCSLWLRTQATKRGTSLHVVHRANEYDSQLALVEAGLGMAMVPRLGRATLSDRVRAVSLTGERPSRRLFVVCRRSSSRRPAIRTLSTALAQQARRLGGRPERAAP